MRFQGADLGADCQSLAIGALASICQWPLLWSGPMHRRAVPASAHLVESMRIAPCNSEAYPEQDVFVSLHARFEKQLAVVPV